MGPTKSRHSDLWCYFQTLECCFKKYCRLCWGCFFVCWLILIYSTDVFFLDCLDLVNITTWARLRCLENVAQMYFRLALILLFGSRRLLLSCINLSLQSTTFRMPFIFMRMQSMRFDNNCLAIRWKPVKSVHLLRDLLILRPSLHQIIRWISHQRPWWAYRFKFRHSNPIGQ